MLESNGAAGQANTRIARLLTVNEVSEITGWKPKTIRQKIWRREIDFVRLGRSIRIEYDALQKLIERSRIPALPPRR